MVYKKIRSQVLAFSIAVAFVFSPVLAEDGEESSPPQNSNSSETTQPAASPPPPSSTVIVLATEELSDAVHAYTGRGYEALNGSRRGTSWSNLLYPPEYALELSNTLEAGIQQSPPFSGTLYRTANKKYFDPTPGATNTDPGFWSFSTGKEYPSRIAESRARRGTETVLMEMSVTEKDSYRTLDVNSMGHASRFPGESEQIGPPGTSVRVVSATQDPKNPSITYVVVEPVDSTPRVSPPSTMLTPGTRVRSGLGITADTFGPATATEFFLETATGSDIVPQGTSDVVDIFYEASRSNPGALSRIRSMAQSARSGVGSAASSVRSSAVSAAQQVVSYVRSRPSESAAATAAATEAASAQGTRVVLSSSARAVLSGASVPSAGTVATVAVPTGVVATAGYVVYRDISMFTDPESPSSREWTDIRYKPLGEYNERLERAYSALQEESEGPWESWWKLFNYSAATMETIPGYSIYP